MAGNKRVGDTFNVSSYGQTGGITAGQVNFGGPPPRRMNDAARQQLLSMVPRDRPVDVSCALGDAEAFRYAAEILECLTNEGYRANGVSQSIWAEPIIGVGVDDQSNPARVMVGSNG